MAAAGILVAAFAMSRVLRASSAHVEVDRTLFPVAGIDLSAHNGIVDFDSVAAGGIAFVYLKATEGVSFRDSLFSRNAAFAYNAGLHVGAYHYFRFDCDGIGQARNMLAAVEGHPVTLPLAIDIEEWGNVPDVPTEVIIGRLQAMEATLAAAGRRVVVYTNKNGYVRFFRPAFGTGAEAPGLWICSFTDPPLWHAPWTLWQHSHCARICGVRGPVDLNTFNGTPAQFTAWRQ